MSKETDVGYLETACEECGHRVVRYGVISQNELTHLREQNRVLADERNKLTIAIGQAIVTLRYYAKTAINVRAVDTLDRIEAALTATSQEPTA